WSLLGADLIHHGVERAFQPTVAILFFSATALAVELIGSRMAWTGLRAVSGVQSLALLLAAALQPAGGHPLANLGWVAWPLGLSSLFWILHRQRRDAFDAAFAVRYLAAWLTLAGVATAETAWQLYHRNYLACLGLALGGYAAAGLRYRLREHGKEVAQFSTLALLWAMLFWFAAGLAWIHDVLPEQDE